MEAPSLRGGLQTSSFELRDSESKPPGRAKQANKHPDRRRTFCDAFFYDSEVASRTRTV